MPVGDKLKKLRTSRHISVRQVEKASRRIAEAKNDKRFFISNSWLIQLEAEASVPSICKLFSLSVIYGLPFSNLINIYGVDLHETELLQSLVSPELTQLLARQNEFPSEELKRNARVELSSDPTELVTGKTELGEQLFLTTNRYIACGYIGLDDFTMYPLIRPGALVRVDTRQRKIQTAWPNEHNRPIYFVELRNGYACSWCELQGNQLLIIPHHSSQRSIRTFTYLREAEIVGRVIGFDTNCLDS